MFVTFLFARLDRNQLSLLLTSAFVRQRMSLLRGVITIKHYLVLLNISLRIMRGKEGRQALEAIC